MLSHSSHCVGDLSTSRMRSSSTLPQYNCTRIQPSIPSNTPGTHSLLFHICTHPRLSHTRRPCPVIGRLVAVLPAQCQFNGPHVVCNIGPTIFGKDPTQKCWTDIAYHVPPTEPGACGYSRAAKMCEWVDLGGIRLLTPPLSLFSHFCPLSLPLHLSREGCPPPFHSRDFSPSYKQPVSNHSILQIFLFNFCLLPIPINLPHCEC
jgi:hypothetical protein